MARVAANQDTSEAERTHFLYVQHAHVTSRKGSTVRCEETTDTRITPTATGSDQQLLKLDGRLLYKHKYLTYTHLPSAKSTGRAGADQDDINIGLDDDKTIDRQIVEAMRNDLTNGKSKDGINAGLFPLTSKTQATYSFKLIGRENRNGRDVFHIAFQPKEKRTSHGRVMPTSTPSPTSPCSSAPRCRDEFPLRLAPCSGRVFPASALRSSTHRNPLLRPVSSGFPSASAPSSRCTSFSFSTARSSSAQRIETSNKPTSNRRSFPSPHPPRHSPTATPP